MIIKNRIAECDDGKHQVLDLAARRQVMVHRIEKELGLDAPAIAKAFKDTQPFHAGAYTGGQMPYTFLIVEDGTIEQALAVSDKGPHAMAYNVPAIGVAVLGDFRFDKPNEKQWAALVELCAHLVQWEGCGPTGILGHTEGGWTASHDPTKDCPGKKLDMNLLRWEVQMSISRDSIDLLKAAGVVF